MRKWSVGKTANVLDFRLFSQAAIASARNAWLCRRRRLASSTTNSPFFWRRRIHLLNGCDYPASGLGRVGPLRLRRWLRI